MVKVVSHLSHNWPLVFVFQAQPEILIWSFGQALQLFRLVFSTSFLHLRSGLQHLARPTLLLCCLSAPATLQNTELNLKILLKRGEGFEQSKVSHWFGSWKGIDVTGSSLQLSWSMKFCSGLWRWRGAGVSKWCSGQGKVICVHFLSSGDCPDSDLVSLMWEVKVVLNALQFHFLHSLQW